MVKINNVEELTNYALEVFNGWEELEDITFGKDFSFHVVIKGENWDKEFDQRTAKIVISVYNSLEKIYNELTKKQSEETTPFKKHNLRIIAKTKNGSLDLVVPVDKFLEVLPNMTNEQLLIVGVTFGATFILGKGVNAVKDYFMDQNEKLFLDKQKDKDITLKELDVKEKMELITRTGNAINEALKTNQNMLSAAQIPYLNIEKLMKEDDELIIPATDEIFNKSRIKEEFSTPETTEKSKIYYIDGGYIIQEWKNISNNSITILPTKGNNRKPIRNAQLAIADIDEEKTALIAKHLNDKTEINLQVTVALQGKDIISVIVTDIGEIREGAVYLYDIIK